MLVLLLTSAFVLDDQLNPRAALKSFQELIGQWRATGEPATGTQSEKAKGVWKESIEWSWKFKGEQAWLTFAIDNGKYFTKGELRSLAADQYHLLLTTRQGQLQNYEGKLTNNGRKLVLERTDKDRQEDARLTLSLIGDIRFQYLLETKPRERKLYTRVFQVGATREGESLAGATKSNAPECVVSGGLGTMKVSHQGVTYYVCCTGCLEAFKENPEKYIAEFKAKKK